jgi:hypothetical protein
LFVIDVAIKPVNGNGKKFIFRKDSPNINNINVNEKNQASIQFFFEDKYPISFKKNNEESKREKKSGRREYRETYEMFFEISIYLGRV